MCTAPISPYALMPTLRWEGGEPSRQARMLILPIDVAPAREPHGRHPGNDQCATYCARSARLLELSALARRGG